MRVPRIRFTMRSMLVAVAIIATILAYTEPHWRYWLVSPRWKITATHDDRFITYEFDMRSPGGLRDWRQVVKLLKDRNIEYRVGHLPAPNPNAGVPLRTAIFFSADGAVSGE
jgi:hypothetical protein